MGSPAICNCVTKTTRYVEAWRVWLPIRATVWKRRTQNRLGHFAIQPSLYLGID